MFAAVGVGGAVGSVARWAVSLFIGPDLSADGATGWPWATWAINLAGCAAIGALMVVLTESTRPFRYARPFLGVGVLGGFTTFSAFAVQTQTLLQAGRLVAALTYLLTSVLGGLVAVAAGMRLVRRIRSEG